MVHKIIKILVPISLLLVAACAYDVEEELYGDPGCATQDVSYSQDLIPIIVAQCFNCHDAANNNGNVNLEGYNNVLRYVNNNRLMGSIRHEPGFAAMPQGKAMLVDCDIEKFEEWINDGAPNN